MFDFFFSCGFGGCGGGDGDCVGGLVTGGSNSGLWLWLCWWWFDFFFSCRELWLPHGGCGWWRWLWLSERFLW